MICNPERTIELCLRSVVNLEIIVVDRFSEVKKGLEKRFLP